MKQPIAEELFDLLIQYACDLKNGKIKPKRAMRSSSPALTFCENFCAQFFQNILKKEVKHINHAGKATAIRLRLELKKKNGAPALIQLITWFEQLCDKYPSILALEYGAGTRDGFLEFHNNYLMTLLNRISRWAHGESLLIIEKRSEVAIGELTDALAGIAE